MPLPIIVLLAPNQKPTAEDINASFAGLADPFGHLDGVNFQWPLLMSGDIDMKGNRLLRVRELFSILNMEEFGSTDLAFEQAVNELTNGGLILIPKNTTIQLSRAVKIRGNRNRVCIMGCGHSSQLALAAGADDPAISVDGAGRFSIRNLYINGNRAQNAVGHGLHLKNCEDFELSGLWIGDSASTGTAQASIMVEGSRHFSIKRSWIRSPQGPGVQIDAGCADFTLTEVMVNDTEASATGAGTHAHGFLLRDSIDGKVHSNHITRPARDGISLERCNGVRVSANTITGKADTGIAGVLVSGESEDMQARGIVVIGNIVSEFEVGIQVGAFVQGHVTSNIVRDNTRPLKYDGKGNSQVTFSQNMCMDKPNHGTFTIQIGQSFTNIDLGVAGLPIQAIPITWKYEGSVTLIRDCVPSAVYGLNGDDVVTVLTAKTRPFALPGWYSIEV